MNYSLNLRDDPFQAIKSGRKKVEGRTVTASKKPYHLMKPGDMVTFTNAVTQEVLVTEILFVHHYPTVRLMLEIEGIVNVLSRGRTVEEGIALYNSLPGYKEGIEQYGIYAIGIRLQHAK